jgi:hypothetical protein
LGYDHLDKALAPWRSDYEEVCPCPSNAVVC